MSFYSAKDFALLGAFLLLGFLFGWWLDSLGWGVALGLGSWTVLQHIEYVRFRRWSKQPLSRPNFRTDAWQRSAETLHRSMQRQRKRARVGLLRLREMRAVTEGLPDAAIMLDEHGLIDSFNSTAAAMLNLSPSDEGLHFTELVRDPMLQQLMTGQLDSDVVELASPFQDEVRLEFRLILMADRRGLVLVRDVTQLNRLLSMRQDFIANVSHELRTPLTVILGYLETLQDDDVSTELVHTLLPKLLPPAHRMQALVQDLLLLTRLESSPSVAEDDALPIAFDSLLDKVMAEVESLSKNRHTIKKRVESSARLVGALNEIESVVTNLLTNAIRYSPDGGEIELQWLDIEGGTRLVVQDQGMGIAPEHLSRLTERFYRVDLARARVQGGTGLGLAIVKHVLKRHNSALEIESTLGAGSTFYCDFPEEQLFRPNVAQAGVH